MPKVVSQLQLEANRDNAQLSTGPRTRRGKRRSAENAVKHGLLARNVILTCEGFSEKRADFNKLVTTLVKEIKPTSILERTLVERIATCYWRLQRAQRFEVHALRESITELSNPNDNKVEVLNEELRDRNRDLGLAIDALDLMDEPADKLTPTQKQKLDRILADMNDEGWEIPTDRENNTDAIRTRLDRIREFCDEDYDRIERRLQRAIRRRELNDIERQKGAFLPETDNLARVVRYESMLDRQIHRALAELRNLRREARRFPKVGPQAGKPKPAVADTRKRRRSES